MKKELFIASTVLSLSIQQTVCAQSWNIAGNSNATSSSKLGTTNNISLRFYTNKVQRMIINSAAGYVGIGTTNPVNILTVKSGGGTPAASWLNGLNSPVFVGFGETFSSEFVLASASNTPNNSSVFQGRRSRGTLAIPSMVVNDDYISSLLASAYDGNTFQNPALVGFFVDGVPSPGNVPARISLLTGSNSDNSVERLKVGSTGNFNFNDNQLTIIQVTGHVGLGTSSPETKLHINDQTAAPVFTGINNAGLRIHGFNSPGHFALLGFSGYSDGYTNNLAQIGAKFTNSGSVLSFGTSNNYTTGITNTAMTIDYNGNVAIGTTTTPYSRLHVLTTTGTALEAESSFQGIVGLGTGTNGVGVNGVGTVYGMFANGGTYGVYGQSDSIGLYGLGVTGVAGKSTSAFGQGVVGEGGRFGVVGRSSVSAGIGVRGEATGAYGIGLLGSAILYGVYGKSPFNTGVRGEGADGVSGLGTVTGVRGEGGSFGVYGVGQIAGIKGHGLVNSVGVLGDGPGTGVRGNGDLIGVKGVSVKSGGNGVRGEAKGENAYGTAGLATGKSGIGVYGYSALLNAVTGYIGPNSIGWAGEFWGDVTCASLFEYSDRRLKLDVNELNSAMDIIKTLQPKSYNFKHTGNFKYMNLPKGRHYGLIAQEVEQVLPNLVRNSKFYFPKTLLPGEQNAGDTLINSSDIQVPGTAEYKVLNYIELIPIMIKAMQEEDEKRQDENKELKAHVKSLEDQIQKLEALLINNSNNNITSTTAYLKQNVPNPFAHNTIIAYYIPETVSSAKLTVTDAIGQVIKTISINNRGTGQLNYNSAMLASGIYNYNLWVEGKQVDTKRLVISR